MKTKALLFITFMLFAIPLRAQDFPSPSGYVNDFVGVLDQKSRDDLAVKTKALKDNKNIELGIAIIKTTGDREIAEYGTALARAWGVGAKDGERRGLLLIVATQDHKSNIQVSRHLEGDLTDSRCGQILRLAREDFKAGSFDVGVTKIADALIAQADSVGIENKSATMNAASVSEGDSQRMWLYVVLGILGIGGLLIYRRRRKNIVLRENAARLAHLSRKRPAPKPSSPKAAVPYEEPYSSTYTSDYTPAPDSYSSSSPASDSSSSSSDSGSGFGGGGDFGGGGASDSW